MTSTGLHRKTVILLLAAVLACPWAASTAPRPGEVPSSTLLDLLGNAWSLLSGAWTKEGCHLDPDGRCAPRPAPRTDEGCHLDPHGGCTP